MSLEPTHQYPRERQDFPAQKLRVLAVANYRISVLLDLYCYAWLIPMIYLYFVHLRVGGPPAGHWASWVLQNYPALISGLMLISTLVLYRQIKIACDLLEFDYYWAAVIAVLGVTLSPCMVGYIGVKVFQQRIRKEFSKWHLPCAWLHYPPKKVLPQIDAKEKQFQTVFNAE